MSTSPLRLDDLYKMIAHIYGEQNTLVTLARRLPQGVVSLDDGIGASLCEFKKLRVEMREILWFVHRPKPAISSVNLEFAGSPRNIEDSPAFLLTERKSLYGSSPFLRQVYKGACNCIPHHQADRDDEYQHLVAGVQPRRPFTVVAGRSGLSITPLQSGHVPVAALNCARHLGQ